MGVMVVMKQQCALTPIDGRVQAFKLGHPKDNIFTSQVSDGKIPRISVGVDRNGGCIQEAAILWRAIRQLQMNVTKSGVR